jgi:glycosyltransferase involved in cell wall biosynthesis
LKIIYDARHIRNAYSGLGRFTGELLFELIGHSLKRQDVEVLVILDANEDYSKNSFYLKLTKKKFKGGVSFVDASPFTISHHLKVSKYVNSLECDLYFYPHFDPPLFINKNVVFTVHDLFPLIVKNYLSRFRFIKKTYFFITILLSLLKKKSRAISVSENTRQDLISYFGGKLCSKVQVVYEGFSVKDTPDLVEKSLCLPERFLFYIGDRRPHKNLKKMISIFRLLKQAHNYPGKFIIAGTPKNYHFNLEEEVGEDEDILVQGNITDEELALVYEKCESLFFLSAYEGFGLPILEAGFRGNKVISSNRGAIPEVLPCWGLGLDLSNSERELAAKIIKYLDLEPVISIKEYQSKFDWYRSMLAIFFSQK